MIKSIAALLVLSFACSLGAQLTLDQKLVDFQVLAGVYAKQYAPYEWKRDALGFDAFDLRPWLERVRSSRDDLEFYEICAEYVARLQDTHSSFRLPSSFSARLGVLVDIYEGKVLLDSIDRTLLPETKYPFQVGDELVSVDGVSAEDWIRYGLKFVPMGNPRAARRFAANVLTVRSQSSFPRAHEIGDAATLEIRRQSEILETYTIPWRKSGTPLTAAGPVPSPKTQAARRPAASENPVPDYLRPLMELRNDSYPFPQDVLNFGIRSPLWVFPENFSQRLGRAPADIFLSGVFTFDDLKIGYLRIPNFSVAPAITLPQLQPEITFLQQNTDGLVVDVMRNSGGDACNGDEIARRLIPYTFRMVPREIRATQTRILSFAAALDSARQQRAEQWIIDLLEARLKDLETAYRENRGRTGPHSLCSTGSIWLEPAPIVYTKPVMLLTDDLTVSGADMFAALFQDNRRGPVFGMRTNGAGGNTSTWQVGFYSEAVATVTQSLVCRKEIIVTPEYPPACYIENIGVRPDIEADYMTKENLLTGGRPFVEAFLAAMARHIREQK